MAPRKTYGEEYFATWYGDETRGIARPDILERKVAGIDPSPYVVERFGERRNIRHGRFQELELHDFEEPFDLIVCSDVLHYLGREEIVRGLPALADRLGGVAFLEVLTRSDEVEGDLVDFRQRPPGVYRRLFSQVGLLPIGLQFYVGDWLTDDLDALATLV